MIRTDVWTLKVTSSQKQLLLLTVAEYLNLPRTFDLKIAQSFI